MNPALPPRDLLACPECDQLQQAQALAAWQAAHCVRCGALLYRNLPHGLERCLICVVCSAIFFLLANLFPLISIEVPQIKNTATLAGAIHFLLQQHLYAVALLMFVCLLLAPALEILALLYLLLPLRLGWRVPGFAQVFRVVHLVRPWGMVEVFLLGVTVSAIRVSAFADVQPGIAAFSSAALMVSVMLSAFFFDEHELWQCFALHEEQGWAH